MNIFIIEDNETYIDAIKQVVVFYGDNIIGVSNDGEGLEKAMKCDIILMDIHLPLISGLELTKNLNIENRELYIIGLSQIKSGGIELVELIKRGFSGYIWKPNLLDHYEEMKKSMKNKSLFFPEHIKK